MKKIELRLSYIQAEALFQMLQIYVSFKQRHIRHNLERLIIAVIELAKLYIYKRIMFHYKGEKKFKFDVSMGFAMYEALPNVEETNELYDSVVRMVIIEIGKQLPE